jgi:multidrug efflux pump subunit AcrA (membrane-fusion protein)
MLAILASFDVMAPEDGMVIYEKSWDGKQIKTGSQIQMWQPTVATLPDLTKMRSKTFVNEVDIRKIKAGQPVEVGLDAYPDKKLVGSVTSVANVGEQRPNSDSKVFEVQVEIKGTDPTLRPAMTTSNRVLTQSVENTLYVPLESLHSEHDSITYVFVKDGIDFIKQEVVMSESNANDAMVTEGLNENDRLYLSIPSGAEKQAVKLLASQKGKRNKKEAKKEETVVPTAEKNPTK